MTPSSHRKARDSASPARWDHPTTWLELLIAFAADRLPPSVPSRRTLPLVLRRIASPVVRLPDFPAASPRSLTPRRSLDDRVAGGADIVDAVAVVEESLVVVVAVAVRRGGSNRRPAPVS